MKMLLRTVAFAAAAIMSSAFALTFGAASVQAATAPAMRLSFVQGDVQVKPNSTDDYGPATVNQPVGENDQLWLPEGALAELQMRNGTYLRLDQQSAAQILTTTTKNALQVSLTQGHAYVFYDAPKGGSIQLDTPKHSIRAFDNAVFRVDLSERLDTVGVFDGSVEVETTEGVKRVTRGQMLSFLEDGSVDIGPAGRADDWENWNNQRNAAMAPRENDQSKTYLPNELQTYSADLSGGKWVDSKEHGHVWRPQDVDDDWSPYDNGRWIWYGGEYTWVGYESWGWAPYHYGRWVYIPGEGWAWAPPLEDDVYWAPGYVAWYETDDYIGWCPLGPEEYYYGYGYYGRYSHDIHVHAHFEYHEHRYFHDHHGLKVVQRRDFSEHGGGDGARHGYRYAKMDSDGFSDHAKGTDKGGFTAGGPSVKPSHSQYFASNKSIGHDKAPPSHVANYRASDFKQSRNFVQHSGQSAFSSGGGKPGAMKVRTVHDARSFGGGSSGGQRFQQSGGAKYSKDSRADRFSRHSGGGADRFSHGAGDQIHGGKGSGRSSLSHAGGQVGSERKHVSRTGGGGDHMGGDHGRRNAHAGGGRYMQSHSNGGNNARHSSMGGGRSSHFSSNGSLRNHPGHYSTGGSRYGGMSSRSGNFGGGRAGAFHGGGRSGFGGIPHGGGGMPHGGGGGHRAGSATYRH